MSSSLESSEMMPQIPGPTPDPELPLLSWENVQHCLPLSPRSRPSLVDNDLALSNVASVLSAASYPLAGRFTSRRPRGDLNDSEVPFYGGLLLENSPPEDDHDDISASREEAALSNQPPRTLSKRQRPDDNTASPPPKKRGRPRKSVGNGEGNGTNEVCCLLSLFLLDPGLTGAQSDAGYKFARRREHISRGGKQICHR